MGFGNKMKQTVNQYQFTQEFMQIRPNQFTYEGLHSLFNWFEEYETETETEIELDVIALCCEFTEYDNFKEFKNEYQDDNIEDIEDIEDYTQVIKIDDNSFIIQDY